MDIIEIEIGDVTYNVYDDFFIKDVDPIQITKYFKGLYNSNKQRFKHRVINYLVQELNSLEITWRIPNVKILLKYWDLIEPFTYKEAFNIKNNIFKAIVFSSIDIREMIENLGATRVKVEGKSLINKNWIPELEMFKENPYDVIYELYHINGDKLGVNDVTLSVIKCWCTSTDEEHWLWVDDAHFKGESPLEGIASTCMIYPTMKGKIKHIIRQGDVFLFELIEEVEILETDKLESLDANTYFKLLKSQS